MFYRKKVEDLCSQFIQYSGPSPQGPGPSLNPSKKPAGKKLSEQAQLNFAEAHYKYKMDWVHTLQQRLGIETTWTEDSPEYQ